MGWSGPVRASTLETVTTTIGSDPVDDQGELVHADDATAQLCLAFVRLEQVLAARGLSLASVTGLRLRTAVADPADLVEVLAERLGCLDREPPVEIVPVRFDDRPGLLATLEAVVGPEPRTPKEDQT